MNCIDAVYHLAAEHRDDVRPTSLYHEVNVGGAENIVYALEKNGINKLIFTSTVAVYGLNSGEPDDFGHGREGQHQGCHQRGGVIQ